jgi:hypothetical protein
MDSTNTNFSGTGSYISIYTRDGYDYYSDIVSLDSGRIQSKYYPVNIRIFGLDRSSQVSGTRFLFFLRNIIINSYLLHVNSDEDKVYMKIVEGRSEKILFEAPIPCSSCDV